MDKITRLQIYIKYFRKEEPRYDKVLYTAKSLVNRALVIVYKGLVFFLERPPSVTMIALEWAIRPIVKELALTIVYCSSI